MTGNTIYNLTDANGRTYGSVDLSRPYITHTPYGGASSLTYTYDVQPPIQTPIGIDVNDFLFDDLNDAWVGRLGVYHGTPLYILQVDENVQEDEEPAEPDESSLDEFIGRLTHE